MRPWMVVLSFTQRFDEQFRSLIPAEQAHVRELIAQKVVEAIYIASDNSKVWLVLNDESEEGVVQRLASFPLRNYFEHEIVRLN